MLSPFHLSAQEEQSGDTTRFYSLLSTPDAQASIDYELLNSSANGDTVQISWLLKYGADIETKTGQNMTPLFYAVANDRLPAARILLDNGANPNAITTTLETPLIVAARNGNMEIAELLIRDSADIGYTDRYGSTPLHYAAIYGYFYMADMLIYYDADVSKKSNDGTTPLMAATWGGFADVADLLLQKGANVGETDVNGFTPFLIAAQNGDTLMMDLLLKNGADLYGINKYRFDALDICVKINSKEAIGYLLRKGNRWSENPANPISPYAVARDYRRPSMITVLRRSGIPDRSGKGFDQISVGASAKACFHDYYTGLSVSFSEPVHYFGVSGGIDFKPGYTRILLKQGENLYYQYYDKAAVAWAGIFKYFPLTDKPLRGNWYATCSVSGGYIFGNKLKGTNLNPGDMFRFIPSAGIRWMKGKFAFSAAVEYFKTDFYKVGPVWIRTGLTFSTFLNHAVSPGKTIKWY